MELFSANYVYYYFFFKNLKNITKHISKYYWHSVELDHRVGSSKHFTGMVKTSSHYIKAN